MEETLAPARPEARSRRARARLTALVLLAATMVGLSTVGLQSPASADGITATRTSTSITWTTDDFSLFSGKLTGHAIVTMHKDGSANFAIHAHQSGVLVRNYAFGCVVKSHSGAAYTFEHHGKVGPRRGGGRTEDWSESVNKPAIKADWPNITSGWSINCRMEGSWDVGGMFARIFDKRTVTTVVTVVGAIVAAA